MDIPALLKRVSLFSVLADEQLLSLAQSVSHERVARNQKVMQAGALGRTLFVILSGRVKILRADEAGNEVILYVMGPGEYFGLMALLDDEPLSATAVTLEACEFLTVKKDGFRCALAASPAMANLVIECLVKRVRDFNVKIESLALLGVSERVTRVLLEFSEMEDGRRVVRGKLPRQDVAKMIGASREMVSRVMRDLEIDGFVVPQADGSLLLRENYRNTQ